MKTAFSAISVALVSGLVCFALGRPLDIHHYVVILFATSLLVWTFEQYHGHQDLQ